MLPLPRVMPLLPPATPLRALPTPLAPLRPTLPLPRAMPLPPLATLPLLPPPRRRMLLAPLSRLPRKR